MQANYIKKAFILPFLLVFVLSCNNNRSMTHKIEEIKEVGDSNPTLALTMLDSLDVIIPNQSAAVINQFNLVRLRLQDKAGIVQKSDATVRQLLAFYEKNGSDAEKQEVYYYAGSVYRDVQDTPRALMYFLKSAELAEKNSGLDSIMLRNAYSNLFYLFYGVQDYTNAHMYAKKEYEISRKINKTELTCLMHLGLSYTVLDSLKQAKDIYVYTLDSITASPDLLKDSEILSALLSEFSYIKDTTNASLCFNLLDKNKVSNENDNKCFAYGEYYNLIGKKDSSIYYYTCILHNNKDYFRMYDASKALFFLYNGRHQTTKANALANEYIQISDSLDIGKRQELAATVNNEFKYYKEKGKEEKIIKERDEIQSKLRNSTIGMVVIILLAVFLIIYKRNVLLKELLKLSNDRNKLIVVKKELLTEIQTKDKELNNSKVLLDNLKKELEETKNKVGKLDKDLVKYSEELKQKEALLTEKMEQNQMIINLLHHSELEISAEDVINSIRKASKGTKEMSEKEWRRLYKAIDELYPTFKSQLLTKLDKFNEKQMQVCYLMRIGLSSAQIRNITSLSRATIWRWTKMYSWIQTIDLPNKNKTSKEY